MYSRLPILDHSRSAMVYVLAAAGTGAIDTVEPKVYEIGVYSKVRLFGDDVSIFPCLISLFALLAIRQLMRGKDETWVRAAVLNFALCLLQVSIVSQWRLGAAYATLWGIGIGCGGMTLVHLIGDGVMAWARGKVDRMTGKPPAPAHVGGSRRRAGGRGKALEDDMEPLRRAIDELKED